MKTTGINHIIYPEEQSFRKTALLEGCLPSDCLFCKIFPFFFFFMFCLCYSSQWKWKQITLGRRYTSCLQRCATEPQAYLLEGKKRPGCQGADGSGAGPAEPSPSKVCWALVTGSHMWCHFQLPERDRCTQINITVQYQRLIVISWCIF